MPKPLHKVIAEHKDISKLVVSLNNCMNAFKEEVNKILKSFTSFSELWEKEPEPSVKEYFAEGPLMVDLEAKYRNFKVNYFVVNHMFVVGFLLKSKF
jgi:dynein heavy chain